VERLQVRIGEEPGAAARAFCARYKLPQRLESVLADAIEAKLREKQQSCTDITPTRSREAAYSDTSKENILPGPPSYPNADTKPTLPTAPSGQFLFKSTPIPPPRPPLKPAFSPEVIQQLQQERYSDLYLALKYPEDQVLRGSRVRTSLVQGELLALLEPLLGELQDMGETLSLQEFQASMVNLAAVLSNEQRRVLFFPFDFPKQGSFLANKSTHARSSSTMI